MPAEREDDHRVAAAVAGVVLLVLVAAAVLVGAALAWRDDGDGRLLGTKTARVDWPAVAPAFEPRQLTAAPTNAWLTNGGTLYNQRYSPLD